MNYDQLLRDALHALEWIISNWQTIGAYSVGGVTIGTLAHKVERTRGFQDLQKFGLIIVGLASAAGVLVDFALNAHTQSWQVLPKDYAFLASASVFLHKFLVSGAFEKAALKLTKFNSAVKELEQLEASPQAAPVPIDNQFVA